jgi:hypothetical protein
MATAPMSCPVVVKADSSNVRTCSIAERAKSMLVWPHSWLAHSMTGRSFAGSYVAIQRQALESDRHSSNAVSPHLFLLIVAPVQIVS